MSEPVTIGRGVFDIDARLGGIGNTIPLTGDHVRDHGILRQRILWHLVDQSVADGKQVAGADQELAISVAIQSNLMDALGKHIGPIAQHCVARAEA